MNLAAALLTRFLERGQAEDVHAARYYMTMAGTLSGPAGHEVRDLMADTDTVIIANRGLLGIAESQLGDPSALDELLRRPAGRMCAPADGTSVQRPRP